MTAGQDSNELSSQMRNSMMVFVAKFLFMVLPPLIGIFFYILTMTKHDVQISVENEMAKIQQTHQSNVAHMKALNEKREQTYKNEIAKMGMLKDNIEQIHKNNIAEMNLLKKGLKVCKENCDKKNLELKISEKRTVSERFKMDFKVDKKKVEFKFEEVK